MTDAYGYFETLPNIIAADFLGMDDEVYSEMLDYQRTEEILERYRGDKDELAKLFDLPLEVEIPTEVGISEDAITEWMSKEYVY